MVFVIGTQTWSLIRYILKRKTDLKRMLENIRENNPNLFFSPSRDYPFNELGEFLNEIGEIVRQVRIDKECQLIYLDQVVQHVDVGLLAINTQGKVEHINQAAKRILQIDEIAFLNALEGSHPGLPDVLSGMQAGTRKVILLKKHKHLQHLAINLSKFKIGNGEIRLYSMQDIKNELDEKEMEAWQNLIRVLTHEIINSVTPVTMLSSTISGFFKNGEETIAANQLSDADIDEVLIGLGYMEERGKALIDFVNRFRSLTKLPEPKLEETKVSVLFDEMECLKKEELLSKGIELRFEICNPDMIIICDRKLCGSMLINLINNASEAFDGFKPEVGAWVELTACISPDFFSEIHVRDNGKGIEPNLMDSIFIPFFTTREHGSGIGLSLCRQIMRLHRGTISAFSEQGKGVEFVLKF